MPFRHVAMFRWADHVDADHVDRVRIAFDELAGRVPGLRQLAHGNDVGVSEGTFDYLVVADFDDVTAWRAYRDHPAHVLLVEELIVGYAVERAAGQFQTPGHQGAVPPPIPTGTDSNTDGPAAADDENDEELLERARRAASAEMQLLMAEPDDPA